MKWLLSFIIFLYCVTCSAQVIVNPVFDRTDSPSFHIDKIEILKDSTLVHISYFAEENSWANISPDTFLEDVNSGEVYKILKSEGLPFGPEKREFENNEKCKFKLVFPPIDSSNIYNFIEDSTKSAFNIYGIDLSKNLNGCFEVRDYEYNDSMALKCMEDSDYTGAIRYELIAIKAVEYLYGRKSSQYASWASALSWVYQCNKDYKESIEWHSSAISIWQSLPYDFRPDIAKAYSNLLYCYAMLKDFDNAIRCGENSINIRREIWGRGDPRYAYYLYYVATIYHDIGREADAILLTKESSTIYKKLIETNHSDYIEYLRSYLATISNLTAYYNSTINPKETLKLGQEAFGLLDKLNVDCSRMLGAIYTNYSTALAVNGQLAEAMRYIVKAKETLECAGLSDSRDMASVLSVMGDNYKVNNDTLLAVKSFKEALAINEKVYGKDFPDNASILERLADLCWDLGDFDLSIEYYSQAKDIIVKHYGDKSIHYADIINTLVTHKYLLNRYGFESFSDDFTSLLYLSYDITKNYIESSLFYLEENKRLDFITGKNNLFASIIPYMSSELRTDSLNALAYNVLLTTKGFLLGAEKEYRRTIVQLGDGNSQEMLNDRKGLYEMIYKQEQRDITDRTCNIDSLKNLLRNKEMELSLFLRNKGCNYKRNITWEDVQINLNNREYAIEFGYFDHSDSETLYYALVLSNSMQSPIFIPLCDESKLKNILSNPDKCIDELSEVIWNPIAPHLLNAEIIYFSPAGLLNSIPIEYFPINTKRKAQNDISIYRLSSTRELVNRKISNRIKNAVLYGGLNYTVKGKNVSYTDSITLNSRIPINHISRSIVDSISNRGGFDPLYSTMIEIDSISKIMSDKSVSNVKFVENEGSEDSFKRLSSQDVNCIHIATHGMYIGVNEVNEKKDILNLRFVNLNATDMKNDNALDRSFLVMSGGNMLLYRDSIPLEIDDGLLTAREISLMDLHNADLVVLSACQTGLGDIDSEGVYGLQYGFKMAGVKTILMSLDKVDDEATRILMVEFYRNLMSGQSKPQSLKNAQKFLRSVDNGKYDKPKYWASFIMLDGLN